jgi:Uncharacterised protein family (UPF0014)
MGIIAIPGMMTGSILGGSSVYQAAKLQIIIKFMAAASVVLASVIITIAATVVVVDADHRIRSNRISGKMPAIYRVKDWNIGKLLAILLKSFTWRTKTRPTRSRQPDMEETELLLT